MNGRGIGDRFTLRLGRDSVHLPSVVLAIVVGAAGGWLASLLGTPLPWLLGPLIVVSVLAIRNVRPFGHTVGVPGLARTVAIPVIGVSIGGAFTPQIAGEAVQWWPTLIALFLYIPLAHAVGFLVARRIGGVDPPTAYYSMMPGGLIESVALGEAVNADTAFLATCQFLRLIFCIVMIPVGFTILSGHAVGSASGAVMGGSDMVLSLVDWGILGAAAMIGAAVGLKVGLPAGLILGPLLLSGLAHMTGLVEGGPPSWLINATQLLVGASLGTRFAGRSPSILLAGFKVMAVSIPITFLIAGAFAAALHGTVGEPWEAVFLAVAPGGLAEMSLIALSLQISVIYVTAHHVARIVLSVLLARAAQGWVLR